MPSIVFAKNSVNELSGCKKWCTLVYSSNLMHTYEPFPWHKFQVAFQGVG